MESSLQHPSHRHPLTLRELSENCTVRCRGCQHPIHGSTYCCLDCEIFLHKACAESPPQIRHPCHPEHSLSLSVGHYSHLYRCNGCNGRYHPSREGFIYGCDDCIFTLHMACAVSTLALEGTQEEEKKRKKIKHPAHSAHPLTSYDANRPTNIECGACAQQISGQVLGCRDCFFFLHKSCGKLPKEILKHPLHRQHPINLFTDSRKTVKCKACTKHHGLTYRCDECKFYLGAPCAVSTLPSEDPREEVADHALNKHFLHEHELRRCQMKTERKGILCNGCQQRSEGFTFNCAECEFRLDVESASRKTIVEDHQIIYFERTQGLQCDSCGAGCNIDLKRCVRCESNLQQDRSLPLSVTHEQHLHPLFFRERVVNEYRNEQYCDICEKERNPDDGVYHCAECNFSAHIQCLIDEGIMKNPALEGHQEEEKIEHPSDAVHAFTNMECGACERQIWGQVYGCRDCFFFLHNSCAELPEQILEHPLHPQHPITLFADSGKMLACKACGKYHGLTYRCDECKFYLGVPCTLSTMPPEDQREEVDLFKHFLHRHGLRSLHTKMENKGILCRICGLGISGEVYTCPACVFLVHKRCAELPEEIQHFLHPDHSLKLKLRADGPQHGKCACCSGIINGFAFFNCESETCNFHLDPECVLKTLSAIEEGVATSIKHFAHGDTLTLCYFHGEHCCEACKQRVHGLAYCCQTHNDFVLHKSCAELPLVLNYQFHDHHLLHLQVSTAHFVCSGCQRPSEGFMFNCAKCEFRLDVECTFRETIVEYPLHDHELIYFERTQDLQCDSCGDSCNIDMKRCVPCDFNLHHHCYLLPPTIQSEAHYHPLVFFDKFVDGRPDDQYCDVCEELRNPVDGVYRCEPCWFTAHIQCVFPEWPKGVPVRTPRRKANKQEQKPLRDMLDEEIVALEAEIQEMKKKLKALRIKRVSSLSLAMKSEEEERREALLTQLPKYPPEKLLRNLLEGFKLPSIDLV